MVLKTHFRHHVLISPCRPSRKSTETKGSPSQRKNVVPDNISIFTIILNCKNKRFILFESYGVPIFPPSFWYFLTWRFWTFGYLQNYLLYSCFWFSVLKMQDIPYVRIFERIIRVWTWSPTYGNASIFVGCIRVTSIVHFLENTSPFIFVQKITRVVFY